MKPAKNLYEPYVTPSIIYYAVSWFAITLFALVGRVHLCGRKNLPKKGPFILAANHLAWADVLLVGIYVPRKIVYMAKEEYFSGKLAWIMRLMGTFPVKRGEGDRQALRAADEQLKRGNVLAIFPEGTRSRTHTLAKAHAGLGMIALRAGVPVVPVAVWGSEQVFKKFRPHVGVSYGEPIVLTPKGAKMTRADIDDATDQIMHRIAAMLPPEYRGVYDEQPQQYLEDKVEQTHPGQRLPLL